MLTYILLILGFVILIKGADWLVEGASAIAKKFNISNLVIGLTIVAFGTSAPELFVNLFASFSGNADIAIGNILGSNIANILLILGITAIIYPLKVTKGTAWKEIPLALLAVLVIWIMTNDILLDKTSANILSVTDGLTLIGFFVIFLFYTFSIAKNQSATDLETTTVTKLPTWKSISYIIIGCAGLALGGQWIVNGATSLALIFGVSQSIIALTVVAVGTSLPELATSITAAIKKNSDIAVGNVVGSNIFNIFWILGISSTIKPLPFNTQSSLDIGMVIFATLLLFIWMFVGKKRILEAWQGMTFVMIYFAYIILLIFGDKLF